MQTLRYDLNPADIEAVLAWMERARLDRLMLFTGGVDQYGRPQTPAEAERWVAEREPVARRLAEMGLGLEINVWCTLGHSSQIAWPTQGGYEPQLGPRGETVADAVCPYDPAWRQVLGRLYGIYARLRPETIWIDDDFRYHHHGEADWTCFCPLHLDQLALRWGYRMDRSTLLQAVRTDPAGPVADAWRDTLNAALADTLLEIRANVQAVSPGTRLGLMTSVPEVHAAEGRDWPRLLTALSGPRPAAVRPTLGNYRGGDPREIVKGTLVGWRTKVLVASHPVYPEVESYPYGPWNKSARFLRAQILAAGAVGMDEMTYNCFPYGEQAPVAEPGLESALAEAITVLEAIRHRFPDRVRRVVGVGLPVPPPTFRSAPLYVSGESGDRVFDQVLACLGVGVSYQDGQSVNVLTPTVIQALSTPQLAAYFRQGVVLDAAGAQALQRRGLSRWTGVEVGGVLKAPLQENLGPAMLRDVRIDRIQARQLLMSAQDSAGVKTWMLGAGGKVLGPGLVWAENSLGGRVAVVADDGAAGGIGAMPWRTAARQRLWFETLAWLGRGAVPVLLANAPDAMPLRIEGRDGTLLVIIQLHLDPLPEVTWLLGDPLPRRPWVWRLEQGRWMPLKASWEPGPGTMQRLTLSTAVDPLDVAWFWLAESPA